MGFLGCGFGPWRKATFSAIVDTKAWGSTGLGPEHNTGSPLPLHWGELELKPSCWPWPCTVTFFTKTTCGVSWPLCYLSQMPMARACALHLGSFETNTRRCHSCITVPSGPVSTAGLYVFPHQWRAFSSLPPAALFLLSAFQNFTKKNRNGQSRVKKKSTKLERSEVSKKLCNPAQ